MFGRDMFSVFDDDPFFRDHRSPMNDMMRNFPDPFSMGHRALEGPAGSQRHRQQQGLVPHSGFMGQMGLFSNMDSMFRDMHRQMESMRNDPNSFSYSSSSVMSYSNDGSGQPAYYHAASSERKGPGGVRETRKSVRDSRQGVEKLALGQHIGERGHEYQRSKNTRTGEEEEVRNFMNMDEDEAPQFDHQWRDATRRQHAALGYRRDRHDRRHKAHRSRAIKGLDHA